MTASAGGGCERENGKPKPSSLANMTNNSQLNDCGQPSAAIKPAPAHVIGCDVYTAEGLEDTSHKALLWRCTEDHPFKIVNKSKILSLSQLEKHFNTFNTDIINCT